MIVKLTYAERDTILAALRRWQSYPAAREADSIATGGGKHKPLDNAEIERICKRMTKIERKRDAALLLRQSNNGAPPRANGTRCGSSAAARLTSRKAEKRIGQEHADLRQHLACTTAHRR
jgi:hypothetical protein